MGILISEFYVRVFLVPLFNIYCTWEYYIAFHTPAYQMADYQSPVTGKGETNPTIFVKGVG